MQRASKRIAKKTIEKKSSYLSPLKRKRIQKILEKRDNNVWSAVRKMYNISSGNVSSREGISNYFKPKPVKYNALKNKFALNPNRAILRAITNKSIANITVPIYGNTSRGGVNPAYVQNALKTTNLKYAIVDNNGRLKALALVKNKYPNINSRYINVIAAFPSYGHPMMNRILNNARKSGKKRVNLMAVTATNNNSKANQNALVRWYMSKGFARSGKLNNGQLLPMSHKF
jgi:hypothetical protein